MTLRDAANWPVAGSALGLGLWLRRNGRFARPVLEDFARTRREMKVLRHLPEGPGNGRLALVLALDDESVYGIKLYGMLAAGLRARGWRVKVLQDLRARPVARSYYRAMGLDDFAWLADFGPTPAHQAAAATAAVSFAARSDSFQAVKGWTYEGAWIGPQILSTLSRRTFAGAPDPRDPAVHGELVASLPRVLQHVLACKAAVAALKPDLALVIEANYATFGPMVDAVIGAGAPVIQVTQPWKDDGLILKRLTPATRRTHPSSVSRETLVGLAARPWGEQQEAELQKAFADRYGGAFFLQARNQPKVEKVGRAELVERLGLDPGKPIAVVFSHILWDANLFYGDDLFGDYAEWFVETVRAAVANPRVNWLIKLHPANLWKRAWENVSEEFAEIRLIRETIGPLPPHVRLVPADTTISTLSLFETADFGVTVRGTSGMELPCFGVPVLTAGTGRYSGLGFTEDSGTARAYLDRLGAIEATPPLGQERTRLARVHAHAVFCLRPWAMRSFRSEFAYPKEGSHPLAHNLHPAVRSWAAIEQQGDFARFAAWADSDDVDYLEATA